MSRPNLSSALRANVSVWWKTRCALKRPIRLFAAFRFCPSCAFREQHLNTTPHLGLPSAERVRYRLATFSQVDGLAYESLARSEFRRYVTYRDSLMAQGEAPQQLFALLWQFVFEQYERGPGMTVH